jgi:hypothetical protein
MPRKPQYPLLSSIRPRQDPTTDDRERTDDTRLKPQKSAPFPNPLLVLGSQQLLGQRQAFAQLSQPPSRRL